MDKTSFDVYQSPFSWRYGTDKMRKIFSENNRRKTWRQIWVSLAKAQKEFGLITTAEYDDIQKNSNRIDIEKTLEIEKKIYHDVMSEIRVFADQAKKGGGKIHLGATSTDITDNADIFIFEKALKEVEKKLISLIIVFSSKIEDYQNLPCMAYTHLQPAEPTTLGYRLSIYTQDLLTDLSFLRFVHINLRAKGMKGAVGTSASYAALLNNNNLDAALMSKKVMKDLNLEESEITSQTYPRKTDFLIISVLSSISQSLYKFALDLRIMQSPLFGEWSEPRSSERVGSSAMPFKRNPDKAEKICSLARFVSSQTQVTWENAASSILERTLDDSANRRIVIPQSFLAVDEIIMESTKIIEGLLVFKEKVAKNLEIFGPFSGTEPLMMEAVKRGANRQDIHELIRSISMKAWDAVNKGENNPLVNYLKSDRIMSQFIKKNEIENFLNPASHLGLAQKHCQILLKELKNKVLL